MSIYVLKDIYFHYKINKWFLKSLLFMVSKLICNTHTTFISSFKNFYFLHQNETTANFIYDNDGQHQSILKMKQVCAYRITKVSQLLNMFFISKAAVA